MKFIFTFLLLTAYTLCGAQYYGMEWQRIGDHLIYGSPQELADTNAYLPPGGVFWDNSFGQLRWTEFGGHYADTPDWTLCQTENSWNAIKSLNFYDHRLMDSVVVHRAALNTKVTQAGARSALSLTTTGSGAATYNSTTGVLNVPTPASTSVTISAPSTGNAITSGTAFQPRSGGPCQVLVNTTVTGLLNVGANIVVATSATQNGTYTTVATDAAGVIITGLGGNATTMVDVPA